MGTESKAKTTDELRKKLQQHVEEARTKLEGLKKDIANVHEEDREALRQKSEEIHKAVAAKKEQARQMRADLESWEREKVSHTQEAIASWRQKRELRKLQSRADRAEDYAVNALSIAIMDAEEAEEAMLEAVAARIDAVAAASP
ncbi:MAG TPA: hypothetical protein VGQ83_20890 [Polyangia bacterium]|jgi:chromosome segregation ATPase